MVRLPNGQVIKYRNVAAALAVLLLIIVGISSACSSKSEKNKEKTEDTPSSSVSEQTEDVTEEPEETTTSPLAGNYKYVEYQNSVSLGSGWLAVVDEAHPFTGLNKNPQQLYGYMFDSSGTQIMYGSTTIIQAEGEVLDMFNELAAAFVKETGLKTLMVYSLIPDGEGAVKNDEAYLGTCIDLMTYDEPNGYFDEFTGEGKYSWVADNCYKYGFIMRTPSRLRYVGKAAAAYMHMVSSDLDKFESEVKNYSFDSPLMFADEEDNEYAVYFVGVTEGSAATSIPIPLNTNDKEYRYEISGNNVDGYIVCINLNDTASYDEYYNQDSHDSSAEEPVDNVNDNFAQW